jgi:hypothetical protein
MLELGLTEADLNGLIKHLAVSDLYFENRQIVGRVELVLGSSMDVRALLVTESDMAALQVEYASLKASSLGGLSSLLGSAARLSWPLLKPKIERALRALENRLELTPICFELTSYDSYFQIAVGLADLNERLKREVWMGHRFSFRQVNWEHQRLVLSLDSFPIG